GVLTALAPEQRPAAPSGLARPWVDRLPLAAVGPLAVPVEAGAVPEPAVGGVVGKLPVDHLVGVPAVGVVGAAGAPTHHVEEARVDDPALVDERAAIGDLDLRAGVGVAVVGDPQVVGLGVERAVGGAGPPVQVGLPLVGRVAVLPRELGG